MLKKNPKDAIALKVNGTVLAVAHPPEWRELDPALRVVALSDSPVLVQGEANECDVLLGRLHALSRRRELPVHACNTPQTAKKLYESLSKNTAEKDLAPGTWAMRDVDRWPRPAQTELADFLSWMDQGRLQGRLRHEQMPRVIVLRDRSADGALPEDLERRLSYFNVSTGPHETKRGRS